jgi:dUTP pyrophosphatase
MTDFADLEPGYALLGAACKDGFGPFGMGLLRAAFARLSPRDREILNMRHPDGIDSYSVEDMAGIYRVTRERARQQHGRALDKLREIMAGMASERPGGPPMTTIAFRRLHEAARLPTRRHESDAGLDLHCVEEVVIKPGRAEVIPTGLAAAIPEGHYGKIEGRSSLASWGVFPIGGVLDAGYRGEIKVILYNGTPLDVSFSPRGGAIAQLVILPIATPTPAWVAELPASERGEGGFGSTDRQEGPG